ncbi:Ral guanine nucleotide dissociation stimulator [Tupaia chinensis]|uniref:Ral guanine nucleotide dissociation stimulator n=1 Tax=Tupaia chinensis TaxID=246437 RepID=L9KYB6_TUPCH|nr:Ral guanine nucleotide dissociation stimulator [Tupaia chinensis]
MEEVFNMSNYTFPLGSGQFHHGDNHNHSWSGNGKKYMSGLGEASILWNLQTGTRHTPMDFMAPTFQFSSISYFAKFLCYTQDFTTIPQFPDQTFSGSKKGPQLEPAPAPALSPLATPRPSLEPKSPVVKTVLCFSPKLLAEQLTHMDLGVGEDSLGDKVTLIPITAESLTPPDGHLQGSENKPQEVFKKVFPLDSQGSIWTQRHKWGNKHMAPTARTCLTHYERVVTIVVETCL